MRRAQRVPHLVEIGIERSAYVRSVTCGSCPNILLTASTLAPALIARLAVACLQSRGVIARIFARLTAPRTTLRWTSVGTST